MRGYTARQLVNILTDNGWMLKHSKGSHFTYFKDGMPNVVTVTYHCDSAEVCRPMAKRLLKEAGIH
jgi:predicted RNA binding protein YcfA (HicA-like mRNA interferase family)